ncbi:MAG: T9SS C-terminal target domain-containing protein, partial [Chitinophagia bacterium]|nr:T9SS C-terminal target domain-containing protein [Chitinophagia bacterium]
PLQVKISTIDGRAMLEGSSNRPLDIQKLSAGIYIIRLYDAQGNFVANGKFTKQ